MKNSTNSLERFDNLPVPGVCKRSQVLSDGKSDSSLSDRSVDKVSSLTVPDQLRASMLPLRGSSPCLATTLHSSVNLFDGPQQFRVSPGQYCDHDFHVASPVNSEYTSPNSSFQAIHDKWKEPVNTSLPQDQKSTTNNDSFP